MVSIYIYINKSESMYVSVYVCVLLGGEVFCFPFGPFLGPERTHIFGKIG
jgi:hypothetical protein